MNIAIVTSVWGDYGRYLPDWAHSVAAQTQPPTETVILDAGVTQPDYIHCAETILQSVGIPVIREHIRYDTLGGARNAATAAATTDWAIHLDADDTLTDHAIADVAEIHHDYDVISLGAIRNGQPIVFPDITADKILHRKHGMFSCGAFRRTFWARRPWHTHNDWVDSTFWVGLAHLGARFGSTGRVGFTYRQHDDSVSRSLTPRQRRAAIKQWVKACEQWTLN